MERAESKNHIDHNGKNPSPGKRLNVRRAPPPKIILTPQETIAALKDFLKSAKKPLVAIVGPTASGKTALSIRLAKLFHGEVINADSRQFYRGMNIGTAKITPDETEGIPHHLLDFLDPDEEYSVALFKDKAETVARQIAGRGNLPFLVGGSGLFTDAICKNFAIPRVAPDWNLRKELEQKTTEELIEMLRLRDNNAIQTGTEWSRRRIIRALEVIIVSGKKMSEQKSSAKPEWDVFLAGVWIDPEELDLKIKRRTEIIWQAGFLEEVNRLVAMGYTEQSPAMVAHGYREAVRFLNAEISETEAKLLMTRNTGRYAKRQRTWWRKAEGIRWVRP